MGTRERGFATHISAFLITLYEVDVMFPIVLPWQLSGCHNLVENPFSSCFLHLVQCFPDRKEGSKQDFFSGKRNENCAGKHKYLNIYCTNQHESFAKNKAVPSNYHCIISEHSNFDAGWSYSFHTKSNSVFIQSNSTAAPIIVATAKQQMTQRQLSLRISLSTATENSENLIAV